MSYTYTTRNGCRVQVDVALAFDKLAAAFAARWGLDLLVRDGTRTREEQAALYQNYLNGGTLAAAPGYSNHEEDGPRGPRALDVHDSGDDPGVTQFGTARANWLRANASDYNFDSAGYSFSQVEPWHIEFTGSLDGSSGGDAAGWNRTDRSTEDIQRLVGANPDGIPGPETDSKLRAWQGANRLDADGIFGPLCEAVGFPIAVDGDPGLQTYAKLQSRVGAAIDGDPGADTWSHLQTALGVPSDGVPGPVTYEALQRAVGADPDGDPGPETWSKVQAFLNTGKAFPRVGVNPASPVTPTQPAPARTADDPTVPGIFTGKYSANSEARTGKVGIFVVHHGADTSSVDTQVARFMNPNDRSVSCTWFMGADGIARKIVHPDDRQWTTGRIIDQQAVTVETQNTSGAPAWGISDASHEGIAQLVVWASKRYGFPIDRQHVLGHEEAREKFDMSIPATVCPGPSMDLDRIVKRALEISTPTVPNPDTISVDRNWLQQIFDKLKTLLGK